MARKPRVESKSGYYHWIQRGIHKKDIFHHDSDFQRFKAILYNYTAVYNIKIYHYCLMHNHIHILLKAESLKDLSDFSKMIARKYTYYYCHEKHWIGSLFQNRFKSRPIDTDEYLLECARYVENNANDIPGIEKPWR
jgi:REP element-mobilizing transposase RayT